MAALGSFGQLWAAFLRGIFAEGAYTPETRYEDETASNEEVGNGEELRSLRRVGQKSAKECQEFATIFARHNVYLVMERPKIPPHHLTKNTSILLHQRSRFAYELSTIEKTCQRSPRSHYLPFKVTMATQVGFVCTLVVASPPQFNQ